MKACAMLLLALAGMAAGQTGTLVCSPTESGKQSCEWKMGARFVTPPPPRSVPAVRKTGKVCAEPLAATTVCLGIQCTVQCLEYKDEQYWTCADPDRALIVSQNGKKAACLLVEEQ